MSWKIFGSGSTNGEWIDERVEKLTAEGIEARNMTMLVEITLDDKNNKLNDATIDLEFLVLERQRLNNELKARGLVRQERDQLTIKKATMVKEEKEKRSTATSAT